MLFMERKFTFQLREADGDDASAIMNNDVSSPNPTGTSTDSGSTNDTDTVTDEPGEAESTSDDDFNIDVKMDEDDTGGSDSDDTSSSGTSSTDSSSSSSYSSSSGSGSGNEGNNESKKANTDIFSSLSAEEQSIKIMELKKLYNTLYTSCDDLLSKVKDIDSDNVNMTVLSRITDSLYQLRIYIKDYILESFPIKSYYENDVMYSRFLTIFTTITAVFEDASKLKNEK